MTTSAGGQSHHTANELSSGRESRAGIDAYFRFYSTQLPQQALGYRTPAEEFNGDSVQ